MKKLTNVVIIIGLTQMMSVKIAKKGREKVKRKREESLLFRFFCVAHKGVEPFSQD